MATQQNTGPSRRSTESPSSPAPPDITAAEFEQQEVAADLPGREQRIASAAYRRAKERDFAPGFELDDWLSAEREIDEQIASEQLRSSTPSMR